MYSQHEQSAIMNSQDYIMNSQHLELARRSMSAMHTLLGHHVYSSTLDMGHVPQRGEYDKTSKYTRTTVCQREYNGIPVK